MSGAPVYIVDGSRTPFIKARGKPGPFTPVDLAVQCGRPLLLRQPHLRSLLLLRQLLLLPLRLQLLVLVMEGTGMAAGIAETTHADPRWPLSRV